jgi:uncharacterized protein involved in outer membrane biogenesis
MKRYLCTHRALSAALLCLILFGLVGFFVLPPIVKNQAEKRLSAELDRAVSIGKVRVNPFALSLTLEDLDIQQKGGGGSFLGWRRLYVRFDALASLAGDWVLGAIELDGFHAALVANPDGSFNFSDILSKFSAPSAPPSKPGRPIRIGRLKVSEARVDFSDHSLKHPFQTQVGPLTFSLTGFRTVGARGAPYHFEGVTEAGERLAWSGTLSADPLESHGEFEIGNLVLKKYAPYFERYALADLTDGKLSVRGRYVADFDPGKRTLTLSDSEVHLQELKVVERATGKPAAEVGVLDVSGLQADAVAMKVAVSRITLTGGHISVRRDRDGSVNLFALLKPADPGRSSPGAGVPAASTGSPQIAVDDLEVKDSAVSISDLSVAHAAQLSLGDVQFSLRNFSLVDGAKMPMHLSFDWAPKGTLKVDGTVALKPNLKADLQASISALDLLPLSPYLEQQVNARITEGNFTAETSLRASMADGKPIGILEGDVSIDKFGLVDAAQSKPLAGFSHLALKGIKVATEPQVSALVDQVDISGPYARVRVEADKSLNISSLVVPATPGGSTTSTAESTPLPRIEVGRVVIDGGNFSFTDRSIDPNVHVSLSDFGGTVSGLSSVNVARAEVGLKGKVDGAGPVEITGKLDPLGAHKFVGLQVKMTNIDLLFLSPYSGKFAGYELARGQLVVDSKILVDGDAVDTTNVVTLKQFTFGAATPSPDATALPVRLGVALLKDTEGKIVIDLPVQGSLGNPEFRVGKVVLRVIVNLLTKAAVSPFSLIGSMFGGGGDELAYQEFAPGSSELLPSELPKLQTLSKALENRPALSLGLEGGYDTAADTYALKQAKLAGLLRRKIWEERHAASPNIAPPDQLVISPEENAAMVKKLFDLKFPPGTQFGTPLPPPPAVTPPPAAPRPGMFRRFVDILTFKAERDQRVAKKEAVRATAQHEENVKKAVAAGLPLDQMTGRLAEAMDVTNNDLSALASTRARVVRDRLIGSGHIAADRLFLSQSPDPAKQNKGPRVLLSLQ